MEVRIHAFLNMYVVYSGYQDVAPGFVSSLKFCYNGNHFLMVANQCE